MLGAALGAPALRARATRALAALRPRPAPAAGLRTFRPFRRRAGRRRPLGGSGPHPSPSGSGRAQVSSSAFVWRSPPPPAVPDPPRGAPAPGPSPRPPAGPGSGRPLAPGDGARPTPARRRPRGHLRAGARPGYLSPRPAAAGVPWRLSRRPSARPARYSMPGGARAGGAHWTRGDADAVPRQLRAGSPRLPGVRAGRVRPRTSGRLLSPRPPTSGGSPRARRGALIRSR